MRVLGSKPSYLQDVRAAVSSSTGHLWFVQHCKTSYFVCKGQTPLGYQWFTEGYHPIPGACLFQSCPRTKKLFLSKFSCSLWYWGFHCPAFHLHCVTGCWCLGAHLIVQSECGNHVMRCWSYCQSSCCHSHVCSRKELRELAGCSLWHVGKELVTIHYMVWKVTAWQEQLVEIFPKYFCEKQVFGEMLLKAQFHEIFILSAIQNLIW